jgi:hypothetical protein
MHELRRQATKQLIFSVVIGFVLCCASSDAKVVSAPTAKNFVPVALEFLDSIYPDANIQKYVVTIRTSGRYQYMAGPLRWFTIDIGERETGKVIGLIGASPGGEAPKDPEPGWLVAKPLISSNFTFDAEDRLQEFGGVGPAVGNPDALAALIKLVNSHAEWTDDQEIAALKRTGALYGPAEKEDFIRILPVHRLEPFLGEIAVVSVDFKGPDKNHVGSFASFYWQVYVKAKGPGGADVNYKMMFEPFKGSLTGIIRP